MSTDTPMSPLMKIVFWFVALNALAGALSLMLFPGHTATLFFWEIKPALNAALFGALYFGGASVVALVTYRGRWEGARFLIPVLVTAGILIALVTFLHLDRFTPGIKLGYWLLIYIGAPLLAGFFYLQHERAGANWAVQTPIAPATGRLAVAVGVVLLGAGVFVLIRPLAVVDAWPWPTTALMVRIFAAWFSAFGVGLLWTLVDRDWGRLRHMADLMIAAAVLDLVMLTVHRGDLTGSSLQIGLFIVHLVAFGLAGVLMHVLQANRRLALPTADDRPLTTDH
jgi:hypothetical protein